MSGKSNSRIYLPLPYSYINTDNNYPQKLLSGLGKSTKRGIKKCFNCGLYNGTRSTMCKNKECGVVLKDSEEKSKVNLDAVKLLTGTERQVYSVRIRDMGPDYRGFVQLPILQSHSEEDANIFSEVALCFVNSCQNSFDNSILKCHEEDRHERNMFCVHINSALKSQSTASPLDTKGQVLRSLKVTEEVKQRLHLLATEREGPVVQRISKSVMAVKCQVSPKHPLGYLHFTFLRGKGKDIYEKYFCCCTEFMFSGEVKDKSSNVKYKCIHYYACIWALASDEKYWDEFSHFLTFELPTTQNMSVNLIPNVTSLPLYRNNSVPKNDTVKTKLDSSYRNHKRHLKRTLRRPTNLKNCKRLLPKVLPVEIKVLSLSKEDEEVSWKFMDWLGYVTESINKTMIFENCSILITLHFHLPEEFYNCFKKRIPSVYGEIQNQEACTYHIMNILHLKEIFDSPQVKLKISKKFVHNEQKGYVEYDENEENSDNGYQCSFIFFLNVGQSTVDESDNTNNPFIIEWLPAVTSLTKVGQLKFQYKYGKKCT